MVIDEHQRVEPTTFTNDKTEKMTSHVDDSGVSGEEKAVNELFIELSKHIRLKRVVQLRKSGDSGVLLGRVLARTEHGFITTNDSRIAQEIVDNVLGDDRRIVDTPGVDIVGDAWEIPIPDLKT